MPFFVEYWLALLHADPAERRWWQMQKTLSELLESMSEAEANLLFALAWMCEQYLSDSNGELDHMCMCAGEESVELLIKYGLLKPGPRGGTWTELGWALLDSK
jgi:hypothetical protein